MEIQTKTNVFVDINAQQNTKKALNHFGKWTLRTYLSTSVLHIYDVYSNKYIYFNGIMKSYNKIMKCFFDETKFRGENSCEMGEQVVVTVLFSFNLISTF